MADTPNRAYPYPGGTGAPNGPFAFQSLADAVDADVEAVDIRLEALEATPATLAVFASADITPAWSNLSGGAVHIPAAGGSLVVFAAQQKLLVDTPFNVTTAVWTQLAPGAVPAAYRPAVNIDAAGSTDGSLGFAPLVLRMTTAGELYARASDRDVTISMGSSVTGCLAWRL